VLGRHVAVLGGAGAAAGGARSGATGLSRLGGLLAGVGSAGLGATLASLALGHLVGRDRFEVLDELITLIAGDAADVESQAARDAMCDVLDELYADADTWEELEATGVSSGSLQTLLSLFLAKYVYNRLPVLAERLARLMDPVAAKEADQQIVRMINDLEELRMPEEPLSFDWGGEAGRAFADDAVRDVYNILASLGDEEDAWPLTCFGPTPPETSPHRTKRCSTGSPDRRRRLSTAGWTSSPDGDPRASPPMFGDGGRRILRRQGQPTFGRC